MARAACLLRAISRALLPLPLLLLLLLLLLPPLMARARPPVSARHSSPREGWARGLGPLAELDPPRALATLVQPVGFRNAFWVSLSVLMTFPSLAVCKWSWWGAVSALDSVWGPASPTPTRDAGVCVDRGSRGSGCQGLLFITGMKQSKSGGRGGRKKGAASGCVVPVSTPARCVRWMENKGRSEEEKNGPQVERGASACRRQVLGADRKCTRGRLCVRASGGSQNRRGH